MNLPKKLLSLQALRGVAIIFVLLTHIKYPVTELFHGIILPAWMSGDGFACGVDIFFVLSGFVISMTAERQNSGPRVFVMQRLIRVMPLYWIVTLPILIGYLYQSMVNHHWNTRIIWNSVFLLPLWDKFWFFDPVLNVGWSLCFEMWFYTLFAAFLFFLPAKKVPWALIGLFLISIPLPFLWKSAWKFPYFAFHPFCWEFAMGCLAFEISKNICPRPFFSSILLLVGVLSLTYFAIHYEFLGKHWITRMDPHQSALRALLWGIPAFVVVLSFVFLETLGAKMNWASPLIYFGNASYAIYLVHIPVYNFIEVKIVGLFASFWMGSTFVLTSALLVGCLLHHLIEKPLTLWLRSRLTRSSPSPVL